MMLKRKGEVTGVDFGPVHCATGAMGFFGEGYWYHKLPWPFGPDLHGVRLDAKTMTLLPRDGNMPTKNNDRMTPADWKPKCIHVTYRSWKHGAALNKVGLTNPGAVALLESGKWQKRTKPFMLSFMAVSGTAAERLEELREFVRILKPYLAHFDAEVALQINFSCPNVGLAHGGGSEFVGEILAALEIAAELSIPLLPKFDVTMTIAQAHMVSEHPACSGIVMSNTVGWGTSGFDWKGMFGTDESPLAHIGAKGGGGLSGKPLLEPMIEWIRRARAIGITVPILACGGIFHWRDAQRAIDAGANGIAQGTAYFEAPWLVRSTTAFATQYLIDRKAP